MSNRRPIVAGNWKMNGSQAESAALLAGIKQGLGTVKKAQAVVCPPFILIPLAARELAGTAAAWGGQTLRIFPGWSATASCAGSRPSHEASMAQAA